MSDASSFILIVALSAAAVWLISLLVEALRRGPTPPSNLRWAPHIPIREVTVDDVRLRYIKTGSGPNLVLLHTLRTQLDLFEKVVDPLARHFTIYALDYPGHGYSDIPDATYDATYFTDMTEKFLDALGLRDVMLAGVSIGASIALGCAARHNPRVTAVVAVNPYDYAKGRGMARSSLAGRFVTYAALVPVLGETVMRLRSPVIMNLIFRGGVADAASLPKPLLSELYRVGHRRGHYRAFLKLLRQAGSWEIATADYRRIAVPVLLVWGDKDWARRAERDRDGELIPGSTSVTLPHSGHFLPLDNPQGFTAAITDFASKREQPRV